MIGMSSNPRPRALRTLTLLPAFGLLTVLATPVLFGRVFLQRDLHFLMPQRALAAKMLAAGRLPQWNPSVLGGMPFFAQPGSGVLYPAHVVFQLLAPATAETVFVLLHLPIAAIGAWLLARVLAVEPAGAAFTAVAYAASGYVLSMHWAHYYLVSAAFLPLVIALLLRAADKPDVERVLIGACAVFVLALQGEPQGLMWSCGGALVTAPFGDGDARARLRRGALVVGTALLGAMLCAVQLLPIWLATRDTTRAAGIPYAQSAVWSLHPVRWLELLVPQPYGAVVPDNSYWGAIWIDGTPLPMAASLYVGPAVLVAAIVAIETALPARLRVWAAMVPLALLVAAGDHLPFYRVWYTLAPLASRFQYPEKFAVIATLGLALLAGRGLDRGPWVRRRAAGCGFGLALALGAALVLVATGKDTLRPLIVSGLARASSVAKPEDAIAALELSLGHAAAVAVCAGLVSLLATHRERVFAPLLLALGTIDLGASATSILSWGDGTFFEQPPRVLADVRAATPPESAGRVFRDTDCKYAGGGDGSLMERVRRWEWHTGKENYLHLYGINSALGYGSIEPTERLRALDAIWHRRGALEALRFFGAATVIRCGPDREARVERIALELPRAAVLPASPVPDPIAAVADPSFDFATRAVIAENEAPASGTALAHVTDVTPEEVVVRTEGGGLLVLFDAWAPGWTATDDGIPAQVVPVDGVWRGVRVQGPTTVTFRYTTPGLCMGALISVVTLAALAIAVALAAVQAARRRRGSSSAA